MERHLRGRRARGRLSVAALCGAWLAAACVPLAPFARPAPAEVDDGASAPNEAPPAPAQPPDLPERGDDVPASTPAASSAGEAAAPQAEPPTEAPAETRAADAPREAEPARAPATPPVESTPAGDPLRAEVGGVLTAFYAAYNAREWKRARTFFWDGATVTDVRLVPDHPTPVVRVTSAAQFFDELGRVREAAGPEGFEGRLEGEPEVRLAGNVAQAWCHFRASFGGPQESMSWRRVDAFTFVLHEGTWKIAALAQSSSSDVPEVR